jgi:drug/metabolite transporter (DMT)-like permease
VQTSGLIALAAAACWGGGDFSGGMGVKGVGGSTRAALRFIVLAHALSLVVLLCMLLASHAAMPSGAPMVWGLTAGVTGGLALTAFYMALSRGEMGVSAAVSGLLAAAIPAVVSTVMEGAPSLLRLAGFVLAGIAIWVIAAAPSHEDAGPRDKSTFWLAVAGGLGFGVYFVALRMANSLGVVMPMALARVASVSVCGLLALAMRLGSGREAVSAGLKTVLLWAAGVAVMDTGGNMLFVAATRMGRLDVAAVLASLYPASTILLAAWRLHERPTRRQLVGMGVAVAAVVMITV